MLRASVCRLELATIHLYLTDSELYLTEAVFPEISYNEVQAGGQPSGQCRSP